MKEFSRPYYTCFYWLVPALFFLSACEVPVVVPAPLEPQTPREAYWAALDSIGLVNTQMAKAWRRAGVEALQDSVFIEAPFREIAYFRAAEPTAYGYRFSLKAGEIVQMKWEGLTDSTQFFVDLFQLIPTDSTDYYQYLSSAANGQSDSLAYEAIQEGIYLLRIQPELLTSGRFDLSVIIQPAYGVFPVQGKGNPDIWSVFGDPRDGGRRVHKGIDIFAPRGTPVLAATRGVTRRVRDKGLGGKQVWLYDPVREQSLYYAHLDSQLVVENQLVEAGDTLGTVGNTGNARGTLPHLHLGLYRRGQGAIDPRPYVALHSNNISFVYSDTARLGQFARVRNVGAKLRAAPHPRATKIASLDQHFPVELVAASKYWYRVRLADGFSGYLPAEQLEATTSRIARHTLSATTELLQLPQEQTNPLALIEAETSVDVLARLNDYQLVRCEWGTVGWIRADR